MTKSLFPNIILALSNVGSVYAAYAVRNDSYLLSISILFAGCASFLFHSCEGGPHGKHPMLPGWIHLHTLYASQETYLNIDRIAAITCGIMAASTYGFLAVTTHWMAWLALFVTFISELHYIGVVNDPRWDVYIYSTFHSAWHVFVFMIPVLLSQS